MNRVQKLGILDQLEKRAEEAYTEQLMMCARASKIMFGTEDALAELLIASIPDSIGEDLVRCRMAGCDDIDLRAALAVARQCAVSNFRLRARLRLAAEQSNQQL